VTTRGRLASWSELAGWSPVAAAAIGSRVIGGLGLTNYFNHLADTELDLPAAPPL